MSTHLFYQRWPGLTIQIPKPRQSWTKSIPWMESQILENIMGTGNLHGCFSRHIIQIHVFNSAYPVNSLFVFQLHSWGLIELVQISHWLRKVSRQHQFEPASWGRPEVLPTSPSAFWQPDNTSVTSLANLNKNQSFPGSIKKALHTHKLAFQLPIYFLVYPVNAFWVIWNRQRWMSRRSKRRGF